MCKCVRACVSASGPEKTVTHMALYLLYYYMRFFKYVSLTHKHLSDDNNNNNREYVYDKYYMDYRDYITATWNVPYIGTCLVFVVSIHIVRKYYLKYFEDCYCG